MNHQARTILLGVSGCPRLLPLLLRLRRAARGSDAEEPLLLRGAALAARLPEQKAVGRFKHHQELDFIVQTCGLNMVEHG